MLLNVRFATIDDLDSLAILFDEYRTFYKQPSDIESARNFLFDRFHHLESVLFIATCKDQGIPLGFAQLYPSFSSVSLKRIWILNDLYVREDSRRDGVGRALVKAAQEFGTKTNAKRLILQTATNNDNAQKLYESLGWQRDQSFIWYKTEIC